MIYLNSILVTIFCLIARGKIYKFYKTLGEQYAELLTSNFLSTSSSWVNNGNGICNSINYLGPNQATDQLSRVFNGLQSHDIIYFQMSIILLRTWAAESIQISFGSKIISLNPFQSSDWSSISTVNCLSSSDLVSLVVKGNVFHTGSTLTVTISSNLTATSPGRWGLHSTYFSFQNKSIGETESVCIKPTLSTVTISTGSVQTCPCNLNQYYDSSLTYCANCHPTCGACVSAQNSKCIYCASSYSYNTAENICGNDTCASGYALFNYNCYQCMSNCIQCSYPGYLTQCQKCADSYYFSSPSCILCHSSCKTCTGNTQFQCSSCYDGYQLESSTGKCIPLTCSSGFYPDNSTSSCQPCPSECNTCAGPSIANCTTCSIDSFIETSTGLCKKCTSRTGYQASSVAYQCAEICGDGLNMGQYQCDDGNTINGDGCSSVCQIEPGYSCSGGSSSQRDSCSQIPLVSATISVSGNDPTILIMQFSENMKSVATNSSLFTFDFQADYAVSYSVNIQFINNNQLLFYFTYQNDFLPINLNIVVKQPKLFLSTRNGYLSTTSYDVSLPRFKYLEDSEASFIQFFNIFFKIYLAVRFLIACFESYHGIMPTGFWNFFGYTQYMYFLSFTAASMPGLAYGILDIFGDSAFIFMPTFLGDLFGQGYLKDVPTLFIERNLNLGFITNGSFCFTIFVSSILISLLIMVLNLKYRTMSPASRKFMITLKRHALWALLFRVFFMTFQPLAIFTFLQYRAFTFTFSSIIAVIYHAIVAFIIFLMIKTVSTSQQAIIKSDCLTKYSSILAMVKLNQFNTRMLPLVETIRISACSIFLIFLNKLGTIQIFTLLSVDGTFLVYMFTRKPYVKMIDNIRVILYQTCIVLIEVCCLLIRLDPNSTFTTVKWRVLSVFIVIFAVLIVFASVIETFTINMMKILSNDLKPDREIYQTTFPEPPILRKLKKIPKSKNSNRKL